MSKRLVDIDDELLEQAGQLLGATTMKETVNRSLEAVVVAARRRRHADRLAAMEGLDLDKPKVMSGAVALTARYMADKSALARFRLPAVGTRLRPLLEDGSIATCAIVDLEVLYSSRNFSDYEAVLQERRSLDSAPITPEVMGEAIEFQHRLARTAHHRVPIPDLVISAAARAAGLIVLHYDADFERIAAVGGASHEWVVPQGSVA